MQVALSTKAHPWHLWHEFGHVLAGIHREHNTSDQDHLTYASMDTIQTESDELFALVRKEADETEITVAFEKAIGSRKQFDQHVYLEEVSVEIAVAHYARELQDAPVFKEDVEGSISMLEFFYDERGKFYSEFVDRLKYASGSTKNEEFVKKLITQLQGELQDSQRDIFAAITAIHSQWADKSW